MVSENKYDMTTRVLALYRFAGVTPRMFQALLQHFGNLDRIERADSGKLMAIEGMAAEAANRITKATQSLTAAAEYHQSLKERDILVVSRFDDNYPHRLEELNDPPPILFARGSFSEPSKPIVALTGADEASNEGIELTVEVARKFVEADVQLVASLERGIDAAAHLACRSAKGRSYAVLESGLDDIYPSENVPVAIDIAQNGGLITEYAPDVGFSENNYRSANRLIAGLAQAVVVTELYENSVRTLDLLLCCSQIGKLAFVIVDPTIGAHTDQDSLNKAVSYGAILLVGLDKISDIIKSLV